MPDGAELPDISERLIEIGWWGEIQYACKPSGKMPAKDWMRKSSERIQAKFCHLFRRMAETGVINNKEQFRHLRGKIYEFKRGGDRIACAKIENIVLLSHQFKKGSRKNIDPEIEKAIVIVNQHIKLFSEEFVEIDLENENE